MKFAALEQKFKSNPSHLEKPIIFPFAFRWIHREKFAAKLNSFNQRFSLYLYSYSNSEPLPIIKENVVSFWAYSKNVSFSVAITVFTIKMMPKKARTLNLNIPLSRKYVLSEAKALWTVYPSIQWLIFTQKIQVGGSNFQLLTYSQWVQSRICTI